MFKNKKFYLFVSSFYLVFAIYVLGLILYDAKNPVSKSTSISVNELRSLEMPTGCIATKYEADDEVAKYTYFYQTPCDDLTMFKTVMFPFRLLESAYSEESSSIEDGMIYTLVEFDNGYEGLYIINPSDKSWVACSITKNDSTYHYSFFDKYGLTTEDKFDLR